MLAHCRHLRSFAIVAKRPCVAKHRILLLPFLEFDCCFSRNSSHRWADAIAIAAWQLLWTGKAIHQSCINVVGGIAAVPQCCC